MMVFFSVMSLQFLISVRVLQILPEMVFVGLWSSFLM